MTAPPPPIGVACHGIGTTVPTPQPHPEPGSESDFELDSPPHLTFLESYQELEYPHASPPYDYEISSPSPPPSMDSVLQTFVSDTEEWHSFANQEDPSFNTEEWHSLDDQEDPYFKSLDNFMFTSGDLLPTTQDTLYKEASHQQVSDKYAVSALKHYNNSENNKVKYELVNAITSSGIMERKGCYGHVNFTAKANQDNSKEELFFAELLWDRDTYTATCVLSLEGEKSVGGLRRTKYDNGKMDLYIDAKHCYACGPGIKHPKNGALYETGHVADSGYYYER